jgi:Fur family transcriptional regulator, peroxide stress response regulator
MTDIQLRFNQLTEKLRQRGYRMTPQRLALIRLIAASEGHPSAANLFTSVKGQYPTMSLATVYKTLDLLKDLNEVIEINLHDVSHYDGNKPYSHPHIICTNCRKIIDGDMEESLSKLVRQVEQNMKFKVQRHQLNFYGLCSECQEKFAFDEIN